MLFDTIGGVYDDLGFDVLGDTTFRDLVIARIVEPTSILDVGRVLAELGKAAAGVFADVDDVEPLQADEEVATRAIARSFRTWARAVARP